ncbi:MAG TPA: TadE family protein [Solirubrobacterales bacterium]|nr:TadE family protein [Solirubrobacterales bacterium]
MRRGQALLELALVTPLILLIMLGGIGVGLLVLTRIELQHAAQEAAIAGASNGGCASALGIVPQVLGYAPDDKECSEAGQLVEVTLSESVAEIAPMIPLPRTITVVGRAVVRESPAPEPSG